MRCMQSCTAAVTGCIRPFINFVSKLIYADVVLRNSKITEAAFGV
jgi:hypothetical protein